MLVLLKEKRCRRQPSSRASDGQDKGGKLVITNATMTQRENAYSVILAGGSNRSKHCSGSSKTGFSCGGVRKSM